MSPSHSHLHIVLSVLFSRIPDLLRKRHSALFLVLRPVLALALGPAVEDELARALELAAGRVARAAELGVLEQICHAPLAFNALP